MKKAVGLFLALFFVPLPTFADEIVPDYYAETGTDSRYEYASNHPTEYIDPFSGTLHLDVEDIRIPGRGGMDIVIRRTYSNYQDQVPTGSLPKSLYGVGWNITFGRIFSDDLNVCNTNQGRRPVLKQIDGKRTTLQIDSENNFDFITANLWGANCIATSGGMEVYSPEGMKYTMDLAHYVNGGYVWYTTKIEDSNGNVLDISYHTDYGNYRIDEIRDNVDGRYATFYYNNETSVNITLKSIVSQGRAWTYTYLPVNNPSTTGQRFLYTVKSPENTVWKYEYYDSSSATQKGNLALRRITYPHGATISYTYDWVKFDAASNYKTTSIKTKTVGGRAVPAGVWTYAFFPGNVFTGTNDQTNITAPDNVTIKYWHYGYAAAGNNYGTLWKVGSIVQKEIRSSSTLLQKDTYTWEPLLVSSDSMKRPSRPLNDPDTNQPILKSRTITRGNANYTLTNTAHDSYGNIKSITESGNAGGTRNSTFTYFINTAKWIIHKLENETVTGEGSVLRSYDTLGRLKTENSYGIITNYDYYSSGDLRTITDGRGYITRFADYYRGVARCELRPVKVLNPILDTLHGSCNSGNAPGDVIKITRVVDGFGNITSEVDGRGITTGYGFDKLDRPISINHPVHADESIVWQTDKNIITRGIYSKAALLDGFGREIETSTAEWKRIVAYDIYNRTQKECLPVKPVDTATACTTYQYDAIGRLKTVTNPDATQVNYVYSSSLANTVTITDERNNTRTYTYIAYSDPDERWLNKIIAPINAGENLYTTIDRDKLGNVVQVRQGTQNNSNDRTRTYHYYPTKLLEWIQYPEIGNRKIYFSYDGVGNKLQQWAEGKLKTVFEYDGQNRLVKIDHPETTTSTNFDIGFTYDGNGNVKTVDNTLARWNYDYDSNNNLTNEKFRIGSKDFLLIRGYDTLDHLASLTYPSGDIVDYAPNTEGWPTKAGGYISAVDYWPNGQYKKITLGNNAYTQTTLNTRQWVASVNTKDASGGALIDRVYAYDGVGNVASINDRNIPRTLDLGYDRINRLITANDFSKWGVGNIDYNGNGDITNYTLGNTALAYDYIHPNGSDFNRLQVLTKKISGIVQASKAYKYDGYGNVINDGDYTYGYDSTNRLKNINQIGSSTPEISFMYDGHYHRVGRRSGDRTTFIYYNKDDTLYGEYSINADPLRENIYLGGMQIATKSYGSDCVGDEITFRGKTITNGQSEECIATTSITADTSTVKQGGSVVFDAPSITLGEGFVISDGGEFHAGENIAPPQGEVIEYQQPDALKSPLIGMNGVGAVLWRESYAPYGERQNMEEGAGRVWYTGKYEEQTGLMYFGDRWYNPALGRFYQMDPVQFVEENIHSYNRYAYANNNPYKYVDADGRSSTLAALQRGVTLDQAIEYGQPIRGAGVAAGLSAIAVGMAIDTASDVAVPGKGAIKQGIKKLITKNASKEITKSSRKRVKRLVKDLSDNSRQNNGLSQEKTDQLRRIVEKAGGKIRNDGASGVKGSSAGKPHIQTEGLGKSIDSRHIWTKEGVQ